MFNYLLDELPTEILGCKIRYDFKSILRILDQVENTEGAEQKALAILRGLFVDKIPDDEDLFEKHINVFFEGGKHYRYKSDGKQTVSWEQDSQEIYSSFFQAYKIDLLKENLHWFVFCSLFAGLPEDTPIKKLIELRSWKASKNDSKEYIKEMRERQIRNRILPKEKLHG